MKNRSRKLILLKSWRHQKASGSGSLLLLIREQSITTKITRMKKLIVLMTAWGMAWSRKDSIILSMTLILRVFRKISLLVPLRHQAKDYPQVARIKVFFHLIKCELNVLLW